jgi:hypothetical protein
MLDLLRQAAYDSFWESWVFPFWCGNRKDTLTPYFLHNFSYTADLRGIPARLVLRDSETQFLITRERALNSNIEKVDLTGTHWKTAVELFLSSGYPDEVFVAPKRHPRLRTLLAGLVALKNAGVLE